MSATTFKWAFHTVLLLPWIPYYEHNNLGPRADFKCLCKRCFSGIKKNRQTDRQGQRRNSRDNYFTGMHPVCCPVWAAQGGPLRMLVSVHLQTQIVWSNNSMWTMLWRLTNQVLICQTHQVKNGLLCLVLFTDKPHQERAGSPKHPMFAQLPGSHAHPNTDIYYSMLLKEHWQKNTPKQKRWVLSNNLCSIWEVP